MRVRMALRTDSLPSPLAGKVAEPVPAAPHEPPPPVPMPHELRTRAQMAKALRDQLAALPPSPDLASTCSWWAECQQNAWKLSKATAAARGFERT
jgi:hypothetical protein